MKLIDANLLIYAIDRTSPNHRKAHIWLQETLSGNETVALTWSVLLAFLRITTNSAIFENPLNSEQALDYLKNWLTQPCTTVVHPTERHADVLSELLLPLGTAGNLTSDAHLAALAVEHGAQLYSCDADFSRFSGVVWVNPLQS